MREIDRERGGGEEDKSSDGRISRKIYFTILELRFGGNFITQYCGRTPLIDERYSFGKSTIGCNLMHLVHSELSVIHNYRQTLHK